MIPITKTQTKFVLLTSVLANLANLFSGVLLILLVVWVDRNAVAWWQYLACVAVVLAWSELLGRMHKSLSEMRVNLFLDELEENMYNEDLPSTKD